MPAPPILCSSPRRQRRALCLAAVACGVTGLRAQPAYEVRPWTGATPALRLNDLDGKPWPFAALRGRVVLLNFWASWCEPCRAEMPSLERLAAQQGSDALAVLAINFKESAPTVRRFLERQPLALPVLLDSDGAAAAQCGVRIFPSSLLIDRAGQARMVVVGDMDWAGPAAQALLQPLLARR